MCSDTKGRIAEAVEQMLQTKPVCKITVQSVMEQTQMKRQSFYYHYQDIYNVLEWIVETEVCTPLQFDDAQAPGEWCLQALTLLREKQQLMRKISQALGQDTMYRITERSKSYNWCATDSRTNESSNFFFHNRVFMQKYYISSNDVF